MITRSKENTLKKKDGTLVCAYCLSPITIKHETEFEDGRYFNKYDTYECTCEEWNNDILYNQEKEKLEDEHNEKVKKLIRDAEAELKIKLRLLEKKYKTKTVVKW